MQKAVGHARAVISRILFIGVSIQIIMGIIWMCCSFDDVQNFADSAYYVKVSKSLLFDEYTGILYPFLLMLLRGLEALLGIPYAPILYILQLGAAFAAGCAFVSSFGVERKFWKLWGSLALLTFPMTMQCHMAVLPNSLAHSCFLWLLAMCMRMLSAVHVTRDTGDDGTKPDGRKMAAEEKKESGRLLWMHVLWMYMFWIFAALLLPEYLYFGVVPVAAFFLYRCRRLRREGSHRGRKILCHLGLIIVCGGIIIGGNELTQVPGSRGRVHDSMEASLFRRVSWTSLEKYYQYWPSEVKAAISDEEFVEAENFAENMAGSFQAEIEKALGVEKARAWFGEFAGMVLADNYPQIMQEIAIDAAGYLFPTVITDVLLDGRGYPSYCMRNYEVMRKEHPLITRYYMDYSAWWFVWGVVLSTIVVVLGWSVDWKAQKALWRGMPKIERWSWGNPVFGIVVCVITVAFMVAWYTLREAGLWDYKKALFVGACWMLWMIRAMVDGAKPMSQNL